MIALSGSYSTFRPITQTKETFTNKLILKIMFGSIVLFSIKIAHADGPPIKDGQICVPHQTIKLTTEQIDQAGRYRYILLNSEQKTKLHKIAKTNIPLLLEIITVPYNDCSCGMHFYGLWAKNNEVQNEQKKATVIVAFDKLNICSSVA